MKKERNKTTRHFSPVLSYGARSLETEMKILTISQAILYVYTFL